MKSSVVLAMVALAMVPLVVDVRADPPLPLIPLPNEMERGDGGFSFHSDTAIRFDRKLASEVELVAATLEALSGHKPQLVAEELRIRLQSEIQVDLDDTGELPDSGYRFEVTQRKITIVGGDAAGAFYGMQTLIQLLPAKGGEGWGDDGTATVPAVKILDHPRFGWRGMHLDVGRHFFPVSDVKRLLDWMAFHKLNMFHWHLTEDQGWRVEIQKWPKLTTVGGFRESTPPYGDRLASDGTRYGGFYTQNQIREVVAYAAARHITVVPEIDMPGHMSAAIAAYPELGNSDIPNYAPKVETTWGIHPYVLAPTEEVFQFVDDVFTEICEMFPSEYIHMGGDEAPKDQWEASPRVKALMEKEGLVDGHAVQSYFVKRVEKILESKGRKLIGWDEIREGGLSPNATVMVWRGEDLAIASAREGHDIVMAPNSHAYLDHYQHPEQDELAKGAEYEAIGGLLPVSKLYNYEPVLSGVPQQFRKHVLGFQAQLWTEYMHDFDKVEYHAFPRIAAVAETGWTNPEKKNFDGFNLRLKEILKHYDAAGLNRGSVEGEALSEKIE